MLATRVAKPKLSLNVNASAQPTRPTLSLKSPGMRAPLSPLYNSPAPLSPTVRNTRINQYSTGSSSYSTSQPTYAYTNSSKSRSILKKGSRTDSVPKRNLSWEEKPTVYSVSPIDEPDYYGTSQRMGKEERRWVRRS